MSRRPPAINGRFLQALVALLIAIGLCVVAQAEEAKPPAATQPTAATQPAVGEKAADFSLNTVDDKPVQLAELNKTGPVVVVQLRGWVTYQCPLCTRQVGDLRTHAEELSAAGARIVLVYPGPAEGLKKHATDFLSGEGLPEGFFFVLDPDLKFVNSWGLRREAPKETAHPATFVIDEHGIIRFAKISKSHGDRASAAEVLKALKGK